MCHRVTAYYFIEHSSIKLPKSCIEIYRYPCLYKGGIQRILDGLGAPFIAQAFAFSFSLTF